MGKALSGELMDADRSYLLSKSPKPDNTDQNFHGNKKIKNKRSYNQENRVALSVSVIMTQAY